MDWTISQTRSLAGALVAVDPLGRHLSIVTADTLTVLDLLDGLNEVSSFRMPRPGLVAVHPQGTRVAVLSADGDLRIWPNEARRPTVSAGDGDWLTFTADGRHLLFGSVAAGGAGIDLYDTDTLERLDTVTMVTEGRQPLSDWGEGAEIGCSVVPATAVGFAANIGDDPLVVAAAEVNADRLRVHGVDAEHSYAAQIPGERVSGIALGGRELFVLDDDGNLGAFDWQASGAVYRWIVSGVDMFDDQLWFGSSLFLRDNIAAVEVMHAERLVAVALLDTGSGRRLGMLEVPADWDDPHAYLHNGFLCSTAGGHTRIAAIRQN